ncbi:LysM-like peptidoglycan-binding domain-containing protein [Photobacterium sp. SP02]|uniref:LysM-like peptidoglycan-binding domain-containing protein n=1 Tax=Photobacterium sp. SP02 TaxID=3032280 RepID=UPI0031452291
MGQAKRRNRKKSAPALTQVSLTEWKTRLSQLNWREAGQMQWQKIRLRGQPYWQQLPGFHRKALMVLAPVVLILFLLPASEPDLAIPGSEPVHQEVALNLAEPAPLPVGERPDPASPPRPVNGKPAASQSPVTSPSSSATTTPRPSASAENWRNYKVKKGETLATIFRAKSLPLTDLYAIAAIEGKDKPLSYIKSGQLLRYKQLANGDLDVLQIESRGGDPVMFFRRSDGSFARGQ